MIYPVGGIRIWELAKSIKSHAKTSVKSIFMPFMVTVGVESSHQLRRPGT